MSFDTFYITPDDETYDLYRIYKIHKIHHNNMSDAGRTNEYD